MGSFTHASSTDDVTTGQGVGLLTFGNIATRSPLRSTAAQHPRATASAD